jgi:Fe-S-cluster containining protein
MSAPSSKPDQDAPAATAETGSARVEVEARIGGCDLRLAVSVPAGPTRLDDLMPLLQILSDKIVASAEEGAAEQGRCVSCTKGCGACCRQLVPVSPVEARHVARLVDSLPQPRQQVIRDRFAAARAKLQDAGLWAQLSERQAWPKSNVLPMGLDYFALGIACPFLEEESCSIHLDRPMTCREYLVTSPAEHCARPTPQTVKTINLPANVWTAAARCEPGAESDGYINWVPLIQALDWAAEHPEPPPQGTGPELVRKVLEQLSSLSDPQPLPAEEAASNRSGAGA